MIGDFFFDKGYIFKEHKFYCNTFTVTMFWLMNKYPNWLDRILFERSHTFYRQLKMDYHISLTLHGSYEGITLVKVK